MIVNCDSYDYIIQMCVYPSPVSEEIKRNLRRCRILITGGPRRARVLRLEGSGELAPAAPQEEGRRG